MKSIYSVIFVLLISIECMAQFAPGVEWERCIPNASVTAATTVSDSVFTVLFDVLNCTDSTSVGMRSYDRDGNLLWEKIYSPPAGASYHSFSITRSSTNKYFVTGSMVKQDSTFNLIMIADDSGNNILSKTIYFDSVAAPHYSKIIPDNTGGILFAGETYTSNLRDIMILRLDDYFNLFSEKILSGSLYDYLGGVIPANQGGYLIAAYTTSTDTLVHGNHGREDIWLVRIGESLNIQWSKCYGDSMNEESRSVLPMPDGYLVAGMSQSNSGMVKGHHGTSDYYDYWILKIDTSGNMMWNKSFGGGRGDFVSQMALLKDTSVVITGSSYSVNGDVTDHHNDDVFDDQWTMKMKFDSTVVWKKSTGGTFDDWSHCVTVLDSVDVIIAGGTLSSDGDHQHSCFSNGCRVINGGWIVKLNEQCPNFPTPQFSYTQDGKEVHLNNASFNATGYLWNFGDGTTSTQVSPEHTYTYQGVYQICLQATSDSCSFKTQCVTVDVCIDGVTADFNAQYPGGLTVEFNDQSVNAGYWYWDFGDGSADSTMNPLHEYSANGIYNVTLIVVDSCNNKRDTITKVINTCNGFIADFGFTSQFNHFSFSDATLGGPDSWTWFFGDGSSSLDQNPSHTYLAGGIYSVCLIASNASCPADTFCELVTVSCPPFAASFTYLADDNIIQFTDQSANAIQWSWNFGDGSFSSDQNPIHTFDSAAIYLVCLIANDSCSADTICQEVDIECPEFTAAFAYVQSADTVQFTNESVYSIQWFWNFGDGNFSSQQNPVHIYADPGTYVVCLMTYDGCSHDTVCDSILIYPLNAENFSSEDAFEIFPNPATDVVTISFSISSEEKINMVLEDATGKIENELADEIFSSGRHQLNVDLSSLSKGVYFIEMKSEKGWVTKKLILN